MLNDNFVSLQIFLSSKLNLFELTGERGSVILFAYLIPN